MKVRLIKEPNYTETVSETVKKFISLGEPVPKIGEVYTVVGYVSLEDISEFPHLIEAGYTSYNGYLLKEFDWSELGIKLAFNCQNFKVVETGLIANKYITEDWYEGFVEEVEMIMNFKI